MSDPVILCDANILYSILMTDLVLSLGEAGLFRPRWTNEIHEEWIRNVLEDQPERTREELERRRAFMDQAIDHDLIEGYEHHIENLKLPDTDDRHVLAAAIEGGAEIILTLRRRLCALPKFQQQLKAGQKSFSPSTCETFQLQPCQNSESVRFPPINSSADSLRRNRLWWWK